jgi:hypothetical protein
MLEFIVVVKDCQTGSVLHATFFFRDGMNCLVYWEEGL